MKKETFKKLSLLCVLLSVVVLIPNIIFKVSSPLWILTFPFSAIGIVLGWIGKKNFLVVLNVIMFFSFFILMFLGYFINSQT